VNNLISVDLAQEDRRHEIAAFYKKEGYGGGLRKSDTVLESRDQGRLVGATRLSEEKGVLVLRGMYVEGESQRQGIGRRMLEAAGRVIGSRECWCIPHAHLKEFYSRIGFSECAPELAPRFLSERASGYEKSGNRVIIMRRVSMALSAFDDKLKIPEAGELKKMLGRTSAHWDNLTTHAAAEYAPLDMTWNFAGAKWGWSLRLKQKKRTLLYMTPCKKHFLVGFALGEKAVKAAHEGNLPASVIKTIDEARKFAEGRGVRIEIRNKKDLEAVKELAAIKMAN